MLKLCVLKDSDLNHAKHNVKSKKQARHPHNLCGGFSLQHHGTTNTHDVDISREAPARYSQLFIRRIFHGNIMAIYMHGTGGLPSPINGPLSLNASGLTRIGPPILVNNFFSHISRDVLHM